MTKPARQQEMERRLWKQILAERKRAREDIQIERRKVRQLEARLRPLESDAAERQRIQHVIKDIEVPRWAVEKPAAGVSTPGVPSILATDWHTGEYVNERLIGGVNRYNREVQERRVQQLANGSVELLTRHQANPRYPGLVFAVGGDMVSGGIHEELLVTNWCEVGPAVKLTARYLCGVITTLAEKVTPNIIVPMVTGNHGRLTEKMQFKRRVGTSADAMIYERVAEHFHKDRCITTAIAEGVSVRYRVFDHRYLLVHGDKWSIGQKGGDGIIGPIGPITRARKQLLARAAQIHQEFDTMVMGHWHIRLPLPGLIVGMTLKGFDEMSWGLGFEYLEPTQEMWFTHPERGVTSHHPIFLDPKKVKRRRDPWTSIDTIGVMLNGEEAA